MKKKQTPSEKLIVEKQRVKILCNLQEQKLQADLSYIQQNALSLLISGVSALFVSHTSSFRDQEETPSSAFGYQVLLKDMLPVLLKMAKPLLIDWIVRKIAIWFAGKK